MTLADEKVSVYFYYTWSLLSLVYSFVHEPKLVSHGGVILKLFYFVTHVGSKYYSECFIKKLGKK